MKKIFAIAIAALFAVSVNAQDCCKSNEAKQCCGKGFNPSWFVQFQGGVQMPYTPGDKGDLLSPVFSLNVGRNVTPLWSVRLGIEGCNSKVFNENTGAKQEFKYATGSFDAMLNVTNLFMKKYCHPVNVYAFAGVGCNWSGMATTNSSQFSPNVRVGAQIDYRVSKNLALNIEYRADNTNDQFNGRVKKGSHDWYSSILLGVSLVLPDHKCKPQVQAQPVEKIVEKIVEKVVEKPVVKEVVRTVLPNVFFNCGKSDITSQQSANVKAIADFMNANPDQNITITGYASPEGNADKNQKLSEDRATAVADMLVQKYGISADRISTQAGGPTSDIYAENELNRVAVSVAK